MSKWGFSMLGPADTELGFCYTMMAILANRCCGGGSLRRALMGVVPMDRDGSSDSGEGQRRTLMDLVKCGIHCLRC
jgi:hypothetical protein